MSAVNMDGRVALVTGASSGIGRATAVAFARAGAKVVGIGLDPELGEETMRLVAAEGAEGFFVAADVTDAGQVERAVAETIDRFGRLDYAFNNAGITGPSGPSGDYAEDDWRRVIDVNLTGVWLSMKYELARMTERGNGVIVNCSSVLGHVGISGSSGYVASKHAVIGLTKSAALDYAEQGIRILAVCPGFIETPMIEGALSASEESRARFLAVEPIGRFGDPDEVAKTVVWMCSDDASFMTGASLVVDGGWIAGYRL